MKHDHFWHYAKRMLRRRRLAAGTVVFSIVSAGGLATGLVASGEVLRLILATDPTSSLRSVVEAQVAKGGWIATVVPASLVEMLPTDRLAGVALILAGLCVLTVFGAVANFLHQ
jgi:hypothetical protein